MSQDSDDDQSQFSMIKNVFSQGSKKDTIKRESQIASVSSVRHQILELIQGAGTPFDVHSRDVERIESSDAFIQRFIRNCADNKFYSIQDIINSILEVLQWRQKHGMNDLGPDNLPLEFFNCDIVMSGKSSKEDFVIVFKWEKYTKINDQCTLLFMDCWLWYFDQLEQTLKLNQKLNIIIDLSNCGLDQADIDILLKMIPILISYYPGTNATIFLYNLPWLLKPFFSAILSLLSGRMKSYLKVVGDRRCAEIMGADNVPDYLGGPVVLSRINVTGFGFQIKSNIEAVAEKRGIKKENAEKFRDMIMKASV